MDETIKKVVSNMNIEGFNISEKEEKEITKIAKSSIKKKILTLEEFSDLVKDLKEDESLLLTLYEYSNKNKNKSKGPKK